MNYTPVIGLEVHVELNTKSKMFCGCSASWFGKKPNTQTCPVCLGLPGALPVPNKKAIEWCVMVGLAFNCEIPLLSRFDRKHYFYPDLPKGYQISQYDQPLAVNGLLKVKSEDKKIIQIQRVHLEEDTGKLLHDGKVTLIDFNRSGVPLVEIVTEPDIHSAQEAKEYLQKLQRVIRYLGVSDCDMEKGSMRMEPNISLKEKSENLPDYKVEVKNINSFRFVQMAIDYEIARQNAALEKGEKILQETRGWDEARQMTVSQRSKEDTKDYRYFPEPDIPPVTWKKEDIERIRKNMPASYEGVEKRYIEIYHLPPQYVSLATSSPGMSEVFDTMMVAADKFHLELEPKVIGDHLFNRKIDLEKIDPVEFVKQIARKKTKPAMDATALQAIVAAVIDQNAGLVTDYKAGKEMVINVLIGMVMKEAKGQAQASEVKRLLLEVLNKVR